MIFGKLKRINSKTKEKELPTVPHTVFWRTTKQARLPLAVELLRHSTNPDTDSSEAKPSSLFTTIPALLAGNKQWARETRSANPHFFSEQAQGQKPKLLWIGCADSRVPANQVVGLEPGQIFVHRNIANCVSGADVSCMAVLQYAVEVLKVEHILVVGHYGMKAIS